MLREVRLNTDPSVADLKALTLGDVVYLDGAVYTARESVYKKIVDEGAPFPDAVRRASKVNFHCSPAAVLNDDGSFKVGGVTATASFRFSRWMQRWLDISGATIVIGKGGMTGEDYRTILAPHGTVYLSTVGYGTGALLGRGIKRVIDVFWADELGLAQAMWLFEVERLGPFLVDGDSEGRSLFDQQNEAINSRIERLYEGLDKPALSRIGEITDARKDVTG